MRSCVPDVQGLVCTPRWWGYLPSSPFRCPCKPTTPRRYPSPGASKLCPPGAAWTRTDPSRPQCRGTLGPGLHPAPTPRLGSTSQGTHLARSSGSPNSRIQRKRNLRPAPEEPRKPPHRASLGCHGNAASAPASWTRLRLRKSTESPRTRGLHSHSTQDAPRCLRLDVTTDVTHSGSVLYQRTLAEGGFTSFRSWRSHRLGR